MTQPRSTMRIVMSRATSLAERIIGSVRACALSRKGVAAVEFAMVLPFMMVLYFGMAEVTTGVSAARKLTLLSRSLADLTGRAGTVTDTELNNIFAASAAIMHPFDGSKVKMRVSSIVVRRISDTQVEGRVCWSAARGGATALSANAIVTMPDGFRTGNTSYIVADADMDYTPMIGYVVTGTLKLAETTPWPVRNASEVLRSGTSACLTSPST